MTYHSVLFEVVETLNGTSHHDPGDLLRIELLFTPQKLEPGATAILFLRDKQHDLFGQPAENALPDEKGIYRLISHQGVFVDRGDGAPINPMVEITRLIDQNRQTEIDLDTFILASEPINASRHPVDAQAQNLSVADLIQEISR